MQNTSHVNTYKNNLQFLQINLQHCYAAAAQLEKTLVDLCPDVVLIQEPNINKSGKLS